MQFLYIRNFIYFSPSNVNKFGIIYGLKFMKYFIISFVAYMVV